MGEDPDPERVSERANERRRERAESAERMAAGSDAGMLQEHKYPVTSEELAAEYADQEIDLPNETESLGSVFDRMVDERFDSAEEAREAVYDEITGEAAGPEEYNDERALRDLEDDAASDVAERGNRDV